MNGWAKSIPMPNPGKIFPSPTERGLPLGSPAFYIGLYRQDHQSSHSDSLSQLMIFPFSALISNSYSVIADISFINQASIVALQFHAEIV